MDIGELLSFQPDKPSVSAPGSGPGKRKLEAGESDWENGQSAPRGKKTSRLTQEEKEKILQLVEDENEDDSMDDTAVKKLLLQFEKRVYKNQEMRIKYPDSPEKFMESEVELNEILHEMHVIATVPDLYYILTDLNAVHSLLQLLNHDNTDISIAVVDLLQEMTDVDTLTENEDGANVLIDTLMQGQAVALLVQNMERLDESIKEEADGVHNTLAILENITDTRPEACSDIAQQGIMQWLLRRIKEFRFPKAHEDLLAFRIVTKYFWFLSLYFESQTTATLPFPEAAKLPFDANKLYASEILSILIQNHNDNRKLLGDMDGIDILLQQLATYKRHDPSNSEEIEYMENLFDCTCSALMLTPNKERFLKGEGLQLMNLLLREKKLSRSSAVKVLNHAMSGSDGAENCQKFVDILGLRNIFPLFMKTPKAHKKVGPSKKELDEHIVSIIASMVRNTTATQRQRLVQKFAENDHEKVDRLMELHFQYLDRIRHADERIQKEKNDLYKYGGEIDDETEDEFYIQRLDAGLFTLQLVDYVIMEISVSGPPTIKQRVSQILNMRGGSIKAIKSIMREYAGNIGDAQNPEAKQEEQQKILQLVDKF